MRLRFQSKEILYEIRSVVMYEKMGRVVQKTFYGSDKPMRQDVLLKRAEENIKKKFQDSAGRIISIVISAVYK